MYDIESVCRNDAAKKAVYIFIFVNKIHIKSKLQLKLWFLLNSTLRIILLKLTKITFDICIIIFNAKYYTEDTSSFNQK